MVMQCERKAMEGKPGKVLWISEFRCLLLVNWIMCPASMFADFSIRGWCRNTASVAYSSVEVTDAVIDVLTGLRDYMQDKCEPPVYVSDRRFMKSIQMMQVAAHADGRTAVSNIPSLI